MINQDELYFIFGSRNSGFLADDKSRGFAISIKEDQDKLINYLKTNNDKLMDLWFASHNETCGGVSFEESGFRPHRIVSMLVTIVKNDL